MWNPLWICRNKNTRKKSWKREPGNKIAVLELEGVIQNISTSSLLNSGGYNHERFLEKLEHVGKDRSVDGIILRVNTPGGGVVESDEIHDQIVKVQENMISRFMCRWAIQQLPEAIMCPHLLTNCSPSRYINWIDRRYHGKHELCGAC